MILETENTFKLVTQKNAMKGSCGLFLIFYSPIFIFLLVIPKENSIFTFDIPLYAPPPLDLASLRAPSPVASDEALPAESTAEAIPINLHLDAVPKIRFQLYGNQFRFRSSDRATRKFKSKETIEI